MVFKFRPQFTIYHPEIDKLLFWTDPAGEGIDFVWGDKLLPDYRHMLITMQHLHDIGIIPNPHSFLIGGMLDFLKEAGVWGEIMLIPINRATGTHGRDKTIMGDLNFVKAIRAV